MNKFLFFLMAACVFLNLQAAVNHFRHHLHAARIARNSHQYENALKYYSKAYSTAKTPHQKYASLIEPAKMMIAEKDYSGAEHKLRKIISTDRITINQKASAMYLLGNIKEMQGDLRGAESYYRKGLHRHPTKEVRQQLLTSCALLLFKRGKLDEAGEMLKQATQTYVEHDSQHGVLGTAKLYLARIAVKQNRLNDAHRYFSEVPRAYRVNQWVACFSYQEKINNVLFRQGKFKEALDTLNKAEESMLFPNSSKKWIPEYRALAYLGAAKQAATHGKFEESEELVTKAKQIPVTSKRVEDARIDADAVLLLERGRAMMRKKQLRLAETCFRKAIAMKSADHLPIAHIELAKTFQLQKKYDQAKRHLEAAEKSCLTDDQRVRTRIAFADYFESKRQFDNALEYLNKQYEGEKISPQMQAALYAKLAWIHYRKNDLRAAEDFCRKALAVPEAFKWTKDSMNSLLDKIRNE